MLSTITRDPVITARIRACKAVIKREAVDQRARRVLLSKPHEADAWDMMSQKDTHRRLISALLDIYLVMRGKVAGHLPKDDWRNGHSIAAAHRLIDAEVAAQPVPVV